MTHAQVNTLKRSTSKKAKKSAGKVKGQVKARSLPVLKKSSELQVGGLNRELLRSFTEFMREEGLVTFSFKSKEFEVELKFAGADASVATHAPAASQAPRSFEAPPNFTATNEEHRSAPAKNISSRAIKSPFVGTFYRAPAPGKPAFVEVGAVVSSGDALCVLEAMKLMNEIEAEFKCRILKVLVDDGSPVEYGEALFEVEVL